ncbi:hypothetical protein [Streptomyces violaceusniger]|uniref:Uncharacterized protein n=1 Tax=Streptomyces violaceusniger TaxID=68280 RepID=A0A4D4LMP1_STRVO|nr:hypothetical protein SVIO_112090 [Streptomyces violaceusniger]
MTLLIAAVLYPVGMAVSLWAISAPTDREEVADLLTEAEKFARAYDPTT